MHTDPNRSSAASVLAAIDRDALAAACRQHHIRWLAVFGSHARGEARADSDVDVVVEFAPGMTPGLGIVRVADALRPVFGGRRVDLVTRRGLAPRLRDRVLAEARELYAAGSPAHARAHRVEGRRGGRGAGDRCARAGAGARGSGLNHDVRNVAARTCAN